jgi:diguanylate cyclase
MSTAASRLSGLLSLFGSSHGGEAEPLPAKPEPQAEPPRQFNLRDEGKRQLIEAISDFLLRHDLDVTADNLNAAFQAFSGSNHQLARKIAERERSGKPIDQDWLNKECRDRRHADSAMDELVEKFEKTLGLFVANAQSARTTTSEYKDKLQQHASDLESGQEPRELVTALTTLTKAMAERTHSIEEEMRRTEGEAKSLRKSLARARREAEIDHLTGLPNRRAFEGLLETAHVAAQAASRPLVVAFCDIDHFKKVNDTHGHEAGDRILKAVADSLREISNDCCHVARHGGEEFVMLFEGITVDAAWELLDEARLKLASRRFINRRTEKPFGLVTFSGGVANVFNYPDARAALKAADDALYRAKHDGRNQIVIAR